MLIASSLTEVFAPVKMTPVSDAEPLHRRLVAELVGTGLLVAVVVGSGIAAQSLSPRDTGLQLLENSLATALGLFVLIAVLGPVSGAHLNPVVTLVVLVADLRDGVRPPSWTSTVGYVVAQVVGGVGGAVLANVMFDEPTRLARTERATGPHVVAEVVATAGLVLVVLALARTGRGVLAAPAVAAYIGAAYWFTSSTSFANPAVTVGRMFSDTFAGIDPGSAPAYVGAQAVGGALGLALALYLYPKRAD
jgi:arsenate reductase